MNMECAKSIKRSTEVSPKHSFIIAFEELYIIRLILKPINKL